METQPPSIFGLIKLYVVNMTVEKGVGLQASWTASAR